MLIRLKFVSLVLITIVYSVNLLVLNVLNVNKIKFFRIQFVNKNVMRDILKMRHQCVKLVLINIV